MPHQNTNSFLYTIPDNDNKLSEAANITIQMGALASRQVQTLRSRTYHPDGRLENVAEHSFMLSKVAPELASMLYPELDANLVARFAAVHDDVEAYVGDTPTDMIAGHDPATKIKLEAAGLAQLLKEYKQIPSFIKLIKAYETQQVPEARFVRAVDKLMVLLIHIPNKGAALKNLYTYESFIKSEQETEKRDLHKYGEFDKIVDLRREISLQIANDYLI